MGEGSARGEQAARGAGTAHRARAEAGTPLRSFCNIQSPNNNLEKKGGGLGASTCVVTSGQTLKVLRGEGHHDLPGQMRDARESKKMRVEARLTARGATNRGYGAREG